MDKRIQEFLNRQRVSVLGILQKDYSVHSAALHFSYAENPLRFFFITEKSSRKCQSLLSGKECNASLVIGFNEEEFTTFQAEGKVHIVSGDALQSGWDMYTHKFPDRRKAQNNPEMVLLQFTPSWWRYRDMKTTPMTEIP